MKCQSTERSRPKSWRDDPHDSPTRRRNQNGPLTTEDTGVEGPSDVGENPIQVESLRSFLVE